MPCFKGLAVSIHANGAPLPEHGIQRSSRLSRISSYIPVPPARIPADSTTNKPEQSTFAISITLLTPGQDVPYSAPKPTPDDPYPKAKQVGELPGFTRERGLYTAAIGPYIPLTTSPNETIAAYIYFDGRGKEEVATLLRRGEETWVNSRWVGVPESEGGGLAEREFLFREVGLERWLNGLDLDGKDAAAVIERRRQKMEKRRRARKNTRASDDEEGGGGGGALLGPDARRGVLKYGPDHGSPVQPVSDDDESPSDTGTSDDDDPIPETQGQIKVALFRVLASGEIKRGEYSPQFDAHDDDEETAGGRNGSSTNGASGGEADVDHTTSFAQPKTLDPKSISTQTVTGIDPTDKPYAVFTFFYRGERQLQKMGILAAPKPDKTPTSVKRKSVQDALSALRPLKKEGTVGFSAFRDVDTTPRSRSKAGPAGDDDMESDSDDDDAAVVGKMDDDEVEIKKENGLLAPEDAEKTGEIAEGVRKIKLKRQHSAEPLNRNGSVEARKNSKSNTPSAASTPNMANDLATTPPEASSVTAEPLSVQTPKATVSDDSSFVGSPLKKHRMSLPGFDDETGSRRIGSGSGMGPGMGVGMGMGTGMGTGLGRGMGLPGAIGEVLGSIGHAQASENRFGGSLGKKDADDDEEL